MHLRNIPIERLPSILKTAGKEKHTVIYELTEPEKAMSVFQDWEDLDAGVLACLQNVMGSVFADDPERPGSVMAVIGDFGFCAGVPLLEILVSRPKKWMLVTPQNEAWAELIENNFPAYKRMRYTLKRPPQFDRKKLERIRDALPEGYSFRKIDGELYDCCLQEEMFESCVSVFGSKEKYLELGRGFAVMKDGRIVSAASSYSRYREGIDIEICTVNEERHRGLGSAVAAKLILACLDEGLSPSWDAANKLSVRLAEKLGYEFGREYVCYEMQ